MQRVTQSVGKWSVRVTYALIALFLLFDGGVKVMRLPPALDGTVQLGFPASSVVGIGIVELVCLLAYVFPRTSVLGAILLTGYLGGATAAKVRLEDPWFLFSVVFGVFVWVVLVARNDRLRALVFTSGLPMDIPK